MANQVSNTDKNSNANSNAITSSVCNSVENLTFPGDLKEAVLGCGRSSTYSLVNGQADWK